VAVLAASSAFAETVEAQPGSVTDVPQLVNSPLLPLDYTDKSDIELTRLGARWDDLSKPERDALLREVKLRMAQRKDADGVLMIRTQRRYGRIYRSEDGRYLKIETKVVRVRPAGPGSRSDGAQGPKEFGVGFEQRTANEGDPPENVSEGKQTPNDVAAEAPPVMRVNGPPQ
jgi:hypothetical protein